MLLNQMKALPLQFYNMRVQILQCCKVVKTLSPFCNRKTEYKAHKQQSLKQVKLSNSVMENQKIQSALPLLIMSEKKMLSLLYMRLGLN